MLVAHTGRHAGLAVVLGKIVHDDLQCHQARLRETECYGIWSEHPVLASSNESPFCQWEGFGGIGPRM
jgi:hypothetical protein